MDLRLTLFRLHRGQLDPSVRFQPGGVWRVTRTRRAIHLRTTRPRAP